MTYGTKARVQFHLNEHTEQSDLMRAIQLIQWMDEDTNTSGGIWVMKDLMFTRANGDRSRAPNIGTLPNQLRLEPITPKSPNTRQV